MFNFGFRLEQGYFNFLPGEIIAKYAATISPLALHSMTFLMTRVANKYQMPYRLGTKRIWILMMVHLVSGLFTKFTTIF